MAYTRETLKVYLSLTDDQLRTIGHGNVAKHREVAQAWAEGKVVQVLTPGGNKKWIDLDARTHAVGLSGDKYRIKPPPRAHVTINGKEYSYCPPSPTTKGHSVYRIWPTGTFAVDPVTDGVRCESYRWRTREEAQQFADILNAMLRAEAKE